MKLAGVRKEVLAGLMLVVLLVAVGIVVGQGLVREEREAYTRGAALARLYFSCRQNFPSVEFIERAFAWGEPANCADLVRIDAPGRG